MKALKENETQLKRTPSSQKESTSQQEKNIKSLLEQTYEKLVMLSMA